MFILCIAESVSLSSLEPPPQSVFSLLTALYAGIIIMGSCAVIIVTRSSLFRALHVITACSALSMLSLQLSTLQILFILVLLSHVLYALKFYSRYYLMSCIVTFLGYNICLLMEYLLTLQSNLGVGLLFILYGAHLLEVVHRKKPFGNNYEVLAVEKKDIIGIPDRSSFRRTFNEYKIINPEPSTLVVIQLEGIDQVNVKLGREFGDLLLAQSANRINQQLQSQNTLTIPYGNSVSRIAHLGGCNFVFVLNIGTNNADFKEVINRLLAFLLQPFEISHCEIKISARSSFIDCDEDSGQFDSLVTSAFLALDTQPNERICQYSQTMQLTKINTLVRLSELAHLDMHTELEIYFQPVVRSEDQGVEFIELLVKWQHPKQGLISAEHFIDGMRLVGQGTLLAHFVLERAAEIVMALKLKGINTPVSMNVFGEEVLNNEFIEHVDKVILEHRLSKGDLIIELPANMINTLNNRDTLIISQLRNRGIKICIDGISQIPTAVFSVPHLGFDYIKLTFSVFQNSQKKGLLRVLLSVLEIRRQTNWRTICHRVETQEQLSLLEKLRVFATQGHYISKPLNSVGVISWLKLRQTISTAK